MQTKMLTLMTAALFVAVAVAPVGSAQLPASAVIGNAIPVVQGIDVASTVNPTAGGTTTVPLNVTASDSNGFQDLVSVTVTVLKPDGSTVHIAASSAASNGDGSGVAQTYAYDFAMNFHDDPAVDGATYKVRAVAEDSKGLVSSPVTATFSYTELVAMSIDGSTIDFGAMDPGERSSVAGLNVTNKGNTVVDLDTSGTALANGEGQEIDVDRVKYDINATNMENERALTESAYTNSDFQLAYGPSSSRSTWWQLDVPSGEDQYLPAGSYSGTVTLSAIQG